MTWLVFMDWVILQTSEWKDYSSYLGKEAGISKKWATAYFLTFYGQLFLLKEEREKVGLKLNIQKTTVMASSPITSWQIDGETMETVTDFILGGSKITADGDCSHEIKRRLLLRRKAMTNLDSIIKKQRHYFANKGPSSQSYSFFQQSGMDVRAGL